MTDSPTWVGNYEAPAGKVWKCTACGKRSHDRYGITGRIDWGYDEACIMHAVLVDEEGA